MSSATNDNRIYLIPGKAPRKKIMHITHGLGGIQTYLEYILKYSDHQNFGYVIAAPANEQFQQFCAGRATYYPLKVKREVTVFADLLLLVRLLRLIRKEKPDVLHVHSAKGGFLGRLAGRFFRIKMIYTPHGFSYLSFTGTKRMFFFMLECLSRKWSHILLAVSTSEANRAIYEIGYDPAKVKVIMNAIDTAYDPKQRNYESSYRIGMIGRLTIQKNPMLFLEIAKALAKDHPHLEFRILGAGLDDHLGKSLTEFISHNGLSAKIRLLPWGDSSTSNTFLQNTDIYIMTSVFEGLPFSLLEAMNAGCACVVSKVDGNADVIQNNENGLSCLTKEEFCKGIGSLIRDRALRENLGKAGRLYVRDKHNINAAIRQLHDLYAHI